MLLYIAKLFILVGLIAIVGGLAVAAVMNILDEDRQYKKKKNVDNKGKP